jgi:integrase
MNTMENTQEKSSQVRGDGCTYLRGTTYWVAFYRNGRLIRESAKTSDAEKALKYLRRCTDAAKKAEGAGLTYMSSKLRKRNVSDLIEALRTHFKIEGQLSPQMLSNLRRVDRDFGMYRAMALTGEMVDAYIEQRQTAGDADASINRTTQVLKQAYTFGKFPQQMIPDIRKLSEEGNERKGFFSPSEIERVMESLPKYLQPFTRFGWLTGMRKGEISSLEWADIDGDVIVLQAEDSKNHKARIIPIVDEVAEVVEECRKAREIRRRGQVVTISNLLFHTPAGKPVKEFRKSWRRACCKAGVGEMVCPNCKLAVDEKQHCSKCGADWCYEELKYQGRIFHDLRRSAVRNMTKAGVQRHVAMSISGHKTESMFERYNIKDVEDQREAMRKTQQYLRTVKENVAVMAAGH